jgi:hypothetical protein
VFTPFNDSVPVPDVVKDPLLIIPLIVLPADSVMVRVLFPKLTACMLMTPPVRVMALVKVTGAL